MTHQTTPQFWNRFRRLPIDVRRLAVRSFRHLQDDPKHPGVRFKPVGPYWSARVGANYRAVAVRRGDVVIWFWIGSHAEYNRLIGRG